jgi:signal transduction histidine kinase
MTGFVPSGVRWGAAAAFAMFVVVGVGFAGVDPLRVSAAVAGVAAAVVLARTRGAIAVASAVVAGAGVGVVCHGDPSNVGWFGLVVLASWSGFAFRVPVAMTLGGGALALLITESLTTKGDPGWVAWLVGSAFGAVGFGLLRRERALADRLRQAQSELAHRARVEERERIAHEIHDVVAHALTVSLLHISSARLALDEEPGEAAEALAEAERLGRSALGEVRQAVGMMRSDPAVTARPMPGAAQLPELVESIRNAGRSVTFTVDGELEQLPATVGLALYRVLQEALTNSIRHAPEAGIAVRLRIDPANASLVVDSVGGAPATRRATSVGGVGLHSMRERVHALGGRFEAGPEGRIWRVTAEFPFSRTDAPSGRPLPSHDAQAGAAR